MPQLSKSQFLSALTGGSTPWPPGSAQLSYKAIKKISAIA